MYLYGLFWIVPLVVGLAIVGGIVALIVHFVRKSHGVDPKKSILAWKRFGIGAAISVVTPFFIGFATSAVFEKLVGTNGFSMMVVLAIIFLVVGIILSRNPAINVGLIIGSVLMIVFAIAINSEEISSSVMAIMAGIGLALLIFFAYKKLQEKEVI